MFPKKNITFKFEKNILYIMAKFQFRKKKFFNKAIGLFLAIITILGTLWYLDYREIITIPDNVSSAFALIMIIVVTLFFINLVLRLTVGRIFNFFKDEMEIEQRIFITKLYTIFIYSVGISFILYQIGLSLNQLTIFLGLIATGIAFATRDIILSFFAWLIVLTKKPFKITDVICVGEDGTGVVERIGTFFITLNNGRTLIKVPNKTLLEKNTKNYGKDKVSGEIKLPIKNIPSNLNKKLKELEKEMPESAKISIDTDGLNFFVSIVYSTDFQNEIDIRSELILKVQKKYPELFNAPKSK